MKKPHISVVIPAYNVERYIEETVGSVLNQTFTDFEVIVINDGSTDDTLGSLQRFDDARLFVHTIRNQGVSHARNVGISHARGEYIAFLDGDDVWAPTHLEAAAAFFAENAEIMWWSSRYYRAEAARELQSNLLPPAEVVTYYGAPCLEAHSSTLVLHTSSAKDLLPLFPENMRNAEDWAAWASFADKHPLIGYMPVEEVMYRCRAGSATRASSADSLMEKYMALSQHLSALSVDNAAKAHVRSYYQYRTLQRWWFLFAGLGIGNWRGELRRQKELLGTPLYLTIKMLAFMFTFTGKIVCKILSDICHYQEKRIRNMEKR